MLHGNIIQVSVFFVSVDVVVGLRRKSSAGVTVTEIVLGHQAAAVTVIVFQQDLHGILFQEFSVE